MWEILLGLLQDCSTREAFCFSIRCPDCGRTWRSTPVRFSKAGMHPRSEGKRIVYDTLFVKEKERAREAAAREAAAHFNCCPICGRTVCNGCFLICEDLDMCRSCASRLDERGSPVMPTGTGST